MYNIKLIIEFFNNNLKYNEILLLCEKIMIKLDLKDRKILFYLIKNSRQSLKTIGRNVGMSKELVSYRIRRLIKNKIINNFSIVINFEKLGYSLMQTHYKFININPTIKEEIIDFLVTNKNTMYVSLIEGTNDLQVDFYMGKPHEFESLLDEIREKYHQYVSFKSSRLPIRAEFYDYTFLLDKTIPKTKIINWIWGQSLLCIDDLDFKILLQLSKDSRMPIKNIANNINSTVSTVNYRINQLEKQMIIARYSVNIDWSKIGYRWFHLQISLRDYSKKNQIINHMRNNPNLIRIFKFLNIDVDLHFTLLLQNMQQLRNIIEDISTRFPNSINDYIFYSTFKVYKYNFMIPELLKIKDPLNRGHFV